MSDYDKLVEALEQIAREGFQEESDLANDALPLARQLIQELGQQRKDRAAADRAADDFARELHTMREENERLKEFSKAKGEVIEAAERRLAGFAKQPVSRILATESDTERKRKLEIRMTGLTRAVGEMEPGGREFCLAAIDEWLDYQIDLQARLSAAEGELEVQRRSAIGWMETARLEAQNKSDREADLERAEAVVEAAKAVDFHLPDVWNSYDVAEFWKPLEALREALDEYEEENAQTASPQVLP